MQGEFIDRYDPTVEDSYRKIVELNLGADEDPIYRNCTLEVMDTAGTDQFMAMREMYMRNGDGFLLVYSVISAASMYEAGDIYEQLCRVNLEGAKRVVLVGNKCDLQDERVIPTSKGQALAAKWGVPFYETSAMLGTNVQDAYASIPRDVMQYRPIEKPASKKSCAIF